MAAPTILLARHGETDWSAAGRHTGRTDVPLNAAGREQAAVLRERLAGRQFDRVLVSPLARAMETCAIAGFAEGAEQREEVVELDYGDYEGLTTVEIREGVPGWTVWAGAVPGGESPADAGARLEPLLDELRASGGQVAIFAHGHLLRILAARWIGLAAEYGGSLQLATGTLSELSWERERPAISSWNF